MAVGKHSPLMQGSSAHSTERGKLIQCLDVSYVAYLNRTSEQAPPIKSSVCGGVYKGRLVRRFGVFAYVDRWAPSLVARKED